MKAEGTDGVIEALEADSMEALLVEVDSLEPLPTQWGSSSVLDERFDEESVANKLWGIASMAMGLPQAAVSQAERFAPHDALCKAFVVESLSPTVCSCPTALCELAVGKRARSALSLMIQTDLLCQ